jgi:hypothetical protein
MFNLSKLLEPTFENEPCDNPWDFGDYQPFTWQAVTFEHSPHGWRVFSKGWVFDLRKPVIQMYRKHLLIEAVFNQPIRVGSFCKLPHTYIDFDNSYERKDK